MWQILTTNLVAIIVLWVGVPAALLILAAWNLNHEACKREGEGDASHS